MTIDPPSLILGLAGLGVSVCAIIDNRRQRTRREKAVIAARSIIERVYGTLIGIKSAITTSAVTDATTSAVTDATTSAVTDAINDGLSAINAERTTLNAL
jgi:hypothetical protein